MNIDPALEYLEEIATMNAILMRKMEAEALTVSAEQQALLNKNTPFGVSTPQEKPVIVKDEEDWDVTPAASATDSKHDIEKKISVSKEVEESDEDWDVVPAVKSSEKNKIKEQPGNKNVTPVVNVSKTNKTETHSDDDWDITPAVSISEKNTVKVQLDDDWDKASDENISEKNKVEIQSDDDWNVTSTIRIPKRKSVVVHSDHDWEKIAAVSLSRKGRTQRLPVANGN